MTNGDRLRSCTNQQLTSVYYKLREWAIYSGGQQPRLLYIKDCQDDFLLWLDKESDDLDDVIFQ